MIETITIALVCWIVWHCNEYDIRSIDMWCDHYYTISQPMWLHKSWASDCADCTSGPAGLIANELTGVCHAQHSREAMRANGPSTPRPTETVEIELLEAAGLIHGWYRGVQSSWPFVPRAQLYTVVLGYRCSPTVSYLPISPNKDGLVRVISISCSSFSSSWTSSVSVERVIHSGAQR